MSTILQANKFNLRRRESMPETTLAKRDLLALDIRLQELVKEQVKLGKVRDRNFAEMADIMHKSREAFRAKKPGEKIFGFTSWEKWVINRTGALARDGSTKLELEEVCRRRAFYLAGIGKDVSPYIPRHTLLELGFGKAKALREYAAAKGNIPDSLIKRARESTARALENHIDGLLYKGNSNHREATERFSISGPGTAVKALWHMIEICREAGAGDEMSPVEILLLMCQSWRQEHEREAEHAEKTLFQAPLDVKPVNGNGARHALPETTRSEAEASIPAIPLPH